jgi:hypothetical protein
VSAPLACRALLAMRTLVLQSAQPGCLSSHAACREACPPLNSPAAVSALRRTASGTNSGPIRDQPPSGKRVEFAGMTLMRFNAAGQIQQSLVFR